jgi:lactate 2-monooxygenase
MIESFGRMVQARIYRAGVFGHLPVVPVEPAELERAAQRAMSAKAWSYVNGSAGQQRTDRANTEAFYRHRIVPRMLVDAHDRDLSVELFGTTFKAPVMFAPVGAMELVSPDADSAVAEAANRLGLPMVISTQGCIPMEETARKLGDTPRWYQLYWPKDDDLAASLVHRAEAIGAEAIVVTLDTTILGWRTRDLDIAYLPFARAEGIAQYTSDPVFREMTAKRAELPAEPTPRPTLTAIRALVSQARHYPGALLENLRSPLPRAAVDTFLDTFSRPTMTWDNITDLRRLTDLPILLKGLQDPRDAKLALEHGIDGIIVSNHGGRQVDGAIASLDALPAIADAVAGKVPVLFDSGIRSGADVFKALALGADAVLVGRPWVYGFAAGGVDGIEATMEHIVAELDITMGLVGARSVKEITRDFLAD